MELFIDFEGFLTEDGDFIVAELATISLTDELDTAVLKVFEPPADFSNQLKISESTDFWQKAHGIRWVEESIPYSTLNKVLMEMVQNKQYIYVLGEETKQWLDKNTGYSSTIIDLMKMPHIDRLYSFDPDKLCLFKEKHSSTNNYACAFETVQRMKKWFVSCWGVNPSMEKSQQIFNQLRTLIKMRPQDIACLDEKFILEYASQNIQFIWYKLPPRIQMNLKFIELLPCNEHFNFADGINSDIKIDGPNPPKKYCGECKKLLKDYKKSSVCQYL